MKARNRAIAIVVLLVASFAAHASDRPGWIGMGISSMPGQKRPPWLHVRHVAKDGPAESAGMRSQDVITKIDSRAIPFTSDSEVLQFFGSLKPGQKVKFTVRRTGEERVVMVVAVPMSDAMYERWRQTLKRVEADARRND